MSLKHLFILVLLLLQVFTINSQNVGINGAGANPNASAMLDIESSDKGVLIPRLALTSNTVAAPVTSPAVSLVIYNTATAGSSIYAVTPGYYYWDGTAWIRLATAVDMTPIGTVIAYTGTVAPAGWLLCDGASLSRTTYSVLFNVIGTSYGTASSTTFNIPDFRGMFLRGLDGTAGNDPDKLTRTASNLGGNTGNAIGSKQSDDFKSHGHTSNDATIKTGGYSAPGIFSSLWWGGTSSSTTSNTGGNETRPKNVYVNYIIKY
jgi:microcystin-dependent protein